MALTSAVRNALNGFLGNAAHESLSLTKLTSLVAAVESQGSRGLADKIREHTRSGYFDPGPLTAELRIGRLLATRLDAGVEFLTGSSADILFARHGERWLVEVAHMSEPSPFHEIFYPDPKAVRSADLATRRARAIRRLQDVLERRPVRVVAHLAPDLVSGERGHQARGEQEERCTELAEWLATRLSTWNEFREPRLTHADARTWFDCTPLDSPPGYIAGHVSTAAWRIDDVGVRTVIEKKALKAAAKLASADAQYYVIAVVIDDPYAASGRELLAALFGPLICAERPSGQKTYRPVPAHSVGRVDAARSEAARAIIDNGRFDMSETNLYGDAGALYLDRTTDNVAATFALYYTGAQFVQNPFWQGDIKRVSDLFPSGGHEFVFPYVEE